MKAVVVGEGRMGRAIAQLLRSKDHDVTISDTLAGAQDFVSRGSTMFACVPYFALPEIAECAMERGADYVDLTEDTHTREHIREISTKAPGQLFISGTGLAPGYINMIAGRLARQMPRAEAVDMMCGALPADPQCNPLGYQVSWSVTGLIRECTALCESKFGNQVFKRPALDVAEPKQISNWPAMEAFPTSGGAGTTPHTLDAKLVRYRTLRYPGHMARFQFLLAARDPEKAILRACGELIGPDIVYIAVRAWSGRGEIEHLERVFPQNGLTAIQYATAMGAIRTWEATQGRVGFVRPETL